MARTSTANLIRKLVCNQLFVSLAIIAVSGAIAWRIAGHTVQQAVFVPTSLASCQRQIPHDYQCYAKYYAEMAYNQTPKIAMQAMAKDYNTDSFVKSQCHQLTHIVGRTGYEKTGNLEKAYAQGDSFCWSGYYHGAMEQAAKRLGNDKIRQMAPTICAPFAKKSRYSFDHFNCVHGLGHGLMAVDGYNLFDGLDSCKVLKDSWEQSSCYGGIFMENVMVAARGDGTSAYFKDGQPLYPCTAVDSTYKEQCYLMQTSYILSHNSYDFAKTFDECAKADRGFVDTCYRSLGRDASGSTVSDVARTAAICKLGGDADGAIFNCMLGADRDFVSYFHGVDKAKQLCQAFGEIRSELAEPCLQDVASYYSTF